MMNNKYQKIKFRKTISIMTDDEVLEDGRKAMEEAREESIKNGTSNMTMEEIDAIIALSRKERREQKAVKHGN